MISGLPSHFKAAMLLLFACLGSAVALIDANAAPPVFNPVPDTSLVIRDGSPLDFSRWVTPGPAGVNGKVVIGPTGRLAFANAPSKPAKFSCLSMYLSGAQGAYPEKSTADILAHQIKVHGYNLVRLHYVEATLMTGRVGDFDYDPVMLDRFHYFLSALKREGVYWLIDAMSSENGAYGNVLPHRWIQKYNLKFLIQVDEPARAHWRKIVDTLWMARNPYTGLPTLLDPALAGVTMVNEGGMNFLAATREGGWRPELQPLFVAYLKRKYGTDAALTKAWGALSTGESVNGTVTMPTGVRDYSPRMRDFQMFLNELEGSTAKMMSDHLRSKGYVGPMTAYDNWLGTAADTTRSTLNWIDMHSYHDEVMSFDPGTTLLQTSSIDNLGKYTRWLAASRQAGKPFSVTEFGHPFWNKYRFESALQVPSMAAFQGWDFACQHAEGGVDLSMYNTASRKKALFPYNVGMDPVARAVETVGALLNMRGDVSPAPHRVSAVYTPELVYKDGWYLSVVPDDLNYLSWITGLETVFPGGVSTFPDAIKVTPASTYTLSLGMTLTAAQKLLGNYEQGASLRIESLRRAGIIPASNRTDVTKGVYESETGQLLLDRTNGRFVVQTPRTEALSSNVALSAFSMKTLRVTSINTPALLSASSLDDLPLASSKKILLVFASDAENTGMTFADSERKKLLTLGAVPVRIQASVAKATLALAHTMPMKLTALTLNGEKGVEIPVAQSGGASSFTLDTGNTVTTFFLLEAK